jgi:hypothetical protein
MRGLLKYPTSGNNPSFRKRTRAIPAGIAGKVTGAAMIVSAGFRLWAAARKQPLRIDILDIIY